MAGDGGGRRRGTARRFRAGHGFVKAAFSFQLLKQLAAEQPGGTVFVSPYSAATALQMAANGAAGQTRAEMEQVLGTAGIPGAELNADCKAAASLLASQDTNLVLTTANALWYRQGVEVKAAFLGANQDFFQSTVKALDFRNAPAAEAEINQWASDQTHGRITGIANGMIDPVYTDLVLANAIYFKGKWEDPFDKKLTKERPFHPAAGAEKTLPMMEMSKKFTYHKGTDYQAVGLPYKGGDLAMYVFLPATVSNPRKVLAGMDGEKWHRLMDMGGTEFGFNENEGHLVLPKFKFDNTLGLNKPLEKLGMKTAFDAKNANFSKMFADPHCISEVWQKAFVEVNEEGTEAAAVTAAFGLSSRAC